MRSGLAIFILLLVISGCKREPDPVIPVGNKNFYVPDGFPVPVYDLSNTYSESQFLLGKKLFFDVSLSENGTISCATCHLPNAAFSDPGNAFSTGLNGAIGKRNSPALINLAWQPNFMWDGGINHIEVQPLAPLTNSLEMGHSMITVIENLNQIPHYRIDFKNAYDIDTITTPYLFKALSHYMSCLISSGSKYDKYIRGEESFTASEQNGLELFNQHCNSCHTTPLFTNFTYKNNGIGFNPSNPDAGRYIITLEDEDSLKFKVPTLRNIEVTFPYMHDGRMQTLEDVLDHYGSGSFHPDSDPDIFSISLSASEKTDLISFLKTLSDTEFLNNYKLRP